MLLLSLCPEQSIREAGGQTEPIPGLKFPCALLQRNKGNSRTAKSQVFLSSVHCTFINQPLFSLPHLSLAV